MARINNDRPTSRGEASKAANAPGGRTTRSTRSQSREPSELPDIQQVMPKRNGRKAKNLVPAPAELTTVNESPTIEERLAAELSPVVRGDLGTGQHIRHFSDATQQTAYTTFSVEEIGEMDAELMVDMLPNLVTAANEMCNLLVPEDADRRHGVPHEIRTEGTKHYKLFKSRMMALNLYKGSFGSTRYIQPSTVLRKLFGAEKTSDVPPQGWRIASVLYKINMATMLRTALVTMSNEGPLSEDAYNDFENLDLNFCHGIAGRTFSEDAFRMCLSIVRELCIRHIAMRLGEESFDPCNSIAAFFYKQEGDHPVFRHSDGIHLETLSKEQQQNIENIVHNTASELYDTFKSLDTAEALAQLKERYPWDDFLEHLVTYYLARSQQLDGEIDAAGGTIQLVQNLAKEIQRRADEDLAAKKRASLSRPGGTPGEKFKDGAIAALKARQRKAELKASAAAALAAAPTTAPPAAPTAQMTDPALTQQQPPPAMRDDGFHTLQDDGEVAPPTQVLSATNRSQEQARQGTQAETRPAQSKGKGKSRSLMDRQDGAHRVAWNESDSQFTQNRADGFQYPSAFQSDQQHQGPYYSSGNTNKRPHNAVDNDEPEEFDPTQDVGFETDTRDTTAADLRRRQAPQSTETRRQTLSSSVPGPSNMTMPDLTPRPHKMPRQSLIGNRKNPGSSIPLPPRSPPAPFDPTADDDRDDNRSSGQRFQEAKLHARHKTIVATQAKPQQIRMPWTEAEESALIDLIEDECCKESIPYSALKAMDAQRDDDAGPQLGRRSAEDMRFKARNMKETWLKSQSQRVPENFRHVILDKKAIDKLHRMGIEYHQERYRNRGSRVLDFDE